MPSIIIDTITILMALYALVLSAQAYATHTSKCVRLMPIAICIVYLVAQSGWTAAFLSGNLWGANYNNYIWFLFNALVFTHIIKGIKK